ncbi:MULTISPECIES: RraA family protein [unclassified Isoptericola]|uniref:RraA family protein n=1 Tax=unclassified Isoptericola TaxID=2623355 RepID=UPI003652F71C
MTTEAVVAGRWSASDLRALHAPVICDVLDQIGRHHQFLPPEIRPIATDMVVIGRAMPVLIADVFGVQRNPFGRLTEALDDLRRGEVYLAYNGAGLAAGWGEILTVAATRRGAAGAVIDGFHRDTAGVLEHGFPVFSRGGYAQDAGARKSVLDFRTPVEVGGVLVTPGDLVFGDRDGVVVVPQDVEVEVVERALEKVATENRVLAAVRGGMSTTEAFATFGVL